MIKIYKCPVCGKELENPPYLDGCCSDECFHKNFWDSVLDKDAVVIDGNCYHILPDDKPDCGFLGYGGAEFKIQFNDGRVVVTHNLWNNGEIPKDRHIQDNAQFVKV